MKADDLVYPYSKTPGEWVCGGQGLTVRDHIKIEAMKAILSNPRLVDVLSIDVHEWIEKAASYQADVMIKQSQEDKG